MPRSVSQKMGIKEGTRAFFMNAPESALKAMMPPNLDVSATLEGDFGYIHLFGVTQAEMDDMSHVIRIGYSHGLVESTTLSVDSTWSAMKFTHPKRGKVYHNSYGQLPSPTSAPRRRQRRAT